MGIREAALRMAASAPCSCLPCRRSGVVRVVSRWSTERGRARPSERESEKRTKRSRILNRVIEIWDSERRWAAWNLGRCVHAGHFVRNMCRPRSYPYRTRSVGRSVPFCIQRSAASIKPYHVRLSIRPSSSSSNIPTRYSTATRESTRTSHVQRPRLTPRARPCRGHRPLQR